MTEHSKPQAALIKRQRKHLVTTGIFVGSAALLIGILTVGLGLDQSKVPPAILEKAANQFTAEWIQGQDQVADSQGATFTLDDFKGQPVVLNFWASWCVSCRTEAHEFEAFWQANQASGVKVVGIAIQDEIESAKKFANYYGKTYILGLDRDGKAAIDYGVAGAPETFMIDRQGIIRYKFTGPATQAELTEQLAKIL